MLEYWLPLLGFALVTSLTPGPNVVLIATSGANFGYRRTMPHILGITAGFPLMILAVGLGLGGLFELYPGLHRGLALVGGIYLLYFAWRIAAAGRTQSGGRPSRPFNFFEAAVFQWVNPKAWVVATGAIASFTSLSGSFAWQVSKISLLFSVIAFLGCSLWTLGGMAIGRLLSNDKRRRIFNLTMAAILVLSILPVIGRVLSGP